MNVLSLFSGIGGLDLGLQRAGMTIAGQVEIDPWCRKVLEKHWPEVPRHDDVRTCAEWWAALGRTADLVCGGFPCQAVSVAGKREGQADSRWLWPAFAATVRALRPRYIVVENTPGLTSLGMGQVVGDLAALGYDAEWDCLPACWFGASHIRERIFLVAHPAGARRAPRSRRAGGPPRDEARRSRPDGLGGHVADADSAGFNAGRGLGATWPAPQRGSGWAPEPAMGRVAYGVPDQVDRVRALGNAVVPQVAEHIGRMIMEAAA